jgi:hypothetical protein
MISWVVIDRSTLRRTRKSPAIRPFRIFRTFFQVPYAVSPLFASFTKTAGVWGYSSHSGTVDASSTFKHSDLQMFPRVSELSRFFSNSCALFCTLQKINSFVFKRFCTLSQKPPGVEVPPTFHVSTFHRIARPIAAKRLWCNNPQRRENSSRSGETTPLPSVSKTRRADIGNSSILVPFASRA